jgi:hypothetical protein
MDILIAPGLYGGVEKWVSRELVVRRAQDTEVGRVSVSSLLHLAHPADDLLGARALAAIALARDLSADRRRLVALSKLQQDKFQSALGALREGRWPHFAI